MEIMNVLDKKKMVVPRLRFGEFDGEWESKKVGELCDFIVPGRNKPTTFEGEIPWITTPDIIHNGVITDSKSGLMISKDEAKKVGSKVVPVNSVIISCVGDLGLAATNGKEVVINQQLHAFIPKELIKYKFLLYGLSIQKKYMDKVATKTAVPYMNKDNCNSIPIIFPTLPEQQKIASFLSTVDEKIQQLRRKKELLELYKKGVMQQLFSGKLRFKDEDGKAFGDWEEISIGEIFKFKQGVQVAVEEQLFEQPKNFIRFIRIVDLTKNDEPVRFIKDPGSEHHVKEEDLFMVRYGNPGVVGFGYRGVIANNLFRILPLDKRTCTSFFKYWFEYIKKDLDALASSSTMPALNFGSLSTLKLKLPLIAEQQKIANYLSNIDTKIECINSQIIQSQSFKKGLLQQMFV